MKEKSKKERQREIKIYNREMYRAYHRKQKRRKIPEEEYLTQMKDNDHILEFDHLQTYFYTDQGTVKAVDGISFGIPKGKTVGIVGESGCGKSVTSLSLMRLLQGPQGQIAGGAIRYWQEKKQRAIDLTKIPMDEMEQIRGNEIAMIFQEPMTSLNPVFTIGNQLSECIALHHKDWSKEQLQERSIEMLHLVGIARANEIFHHYPHELSGGMRQRVVIAMALSCNPQLIIADEPTTALDVTIQAQILELLRSLKQKTKASIMLITHDLGVVAEMADEVVIMYAGRVVEQGSVKEIFQDPKHPYTIGLLKSRPILNEKIGRLYSIPGAVPNPIEMPEHCYFKNRCEKAIDCCKGEYPEEILISPTHTVHCHLYKNGKNAERIKQDEE